MVRVVAATLLLSISLLGGCSGKAVGDGSGDGGASGADKPPPKPSPVTQCQTYASTWCDKAFGCYVQVGRLDEGSRQSNVDQCIQLIVNKLPCSAVASVTGDYDTCLSQIKGMACSKWDVPQTQFGTVLPPATCETALSFGE
jgi:hypothetical protein